MTTRPRPPLVLLAVAAAVAALPACGDGQKASQADGGASGGRAATGGRAGGGQPGTGGGPGGGQPGTGGVSLPATGGMTGTAGSSHTGGASSGGGAAGQANGGSAGTGVAGSTSVGAWTMAGAITPQASAGKDLSADVAINPAGEGVVTWLRGAVVMARRYHASTGTWDEEKVVGGKASPSGTDVGIDAAGNALVVWTDDSTSSNLSLWWSRSTADGSTWSAPRRLTATRFMTAPSLAVAANGVALVTWVENINDKATVRACDFRNGEWNTTVHLPKAGTTEATSDPRVAIDGAGKGWLIWRQPRTADQDDWTNRIWVQRYDAGWQPSSLALLDDTDLTDLKYEATAPAVALNEAGAGVAVWVERETTQAGTNSRLWARRFDGTAWLPQEILSRGTFETTPPGPQVAAGADGTLVAAWAQIQATTYQATAARFKAGATGWDVARSVETNNLAGTATHEWVAPILGVDGQGNATMVWRKRVDSPARVVPTTSRLAAGGLTWEPDHGIPLRDSGAATLSAVNIAVARTGTALAIWSSGQDTIWASVYK